MKIEFKDNCGVQGKWGGGGGVCFDCGGGRDVCFGMCRLEEIEFKWMFQDIR